ncbi:putative transcription factor C2H2 family [Dioscorea sansibarensis]
MAITGFLPPTQQHQEKKKKKKKSQAKEISSWEQLKNILSCKSTAPGQQVHDPSKPTTKLMSSYCGSSLCAIRDVVHGNTRVVHRADTDHCSRCSSSPGSSRRHETVPLAAHSGSGSSSRGGMQLRSLSGCYESHAVSVESGSRRYPRPRALCACPDCGEVFTKLESLELHQATRHAVSELGAEDSGRNIVEIIFKSSWHRRCHLPACTIERILKVHNNPRTLARFEDYRGAVKSRWALNPKKHPRCAADGNELLRFLPAPLSCSFRSTSLCSATACGVCGIIRHGFARGRSGIRTMASSGRAHEIGSAYEMGSRRAMMVCRVIAGRVKEAAEEEEEEEMGGFDSVADEGANLEELFVGNPKAILPCFVVIYMVLG